MRATRRTLPLPRAAEVELTVTGTAVPLASAVAEEVSALKEEEARFGALLAEFKGAESERLRLAAVADKKAAMAQEAGVPLASIADADVVLEDGEGVKVPRVGWTKPVPGYKVLCCGNSAQDWGVMTAAFIALYAVVGLFFWALLEANSASDESKAALWVFLALVAAGWATLGAVVTAGQRAKAGQAPAAGGV